MKNIIIKESQIHTIVKTKINESAKDKRKVIRQLYKIVEPFTHSKYHDQNWENVHALIGAIKDAGFDVSVSVEDGGYRNSLGGNTLYPHDSMASYWKEYKLEIMFDDFVIHGTINAHLCGTMEDPYEAYDMTCIFY